MGAKPPQSVVLFDAGRPRSRRRSHCAADRVSDSTAHRDTAPGYGPADAAAPVPDSRGGRAGIARSADATPENPQAATPIRTARTVAAVDCHWPRKAAEGHWQKGRGDHSQAAEGAIGYRWRYRADNRVECRLLDRRADLRARDELVLRRGQTAKGAAASEQSTSRASASSSSGTHKPGASCSPADTEITSEAGGAIGAACCAQQLAAVDRHPGHGPAGANPCPGHAGGYCGSSAFADCSDWQGARCRRLGLCVDACQGQEPTDCRATFPCAALGPLDFASSAAARVSGPSCPEGQDKDLRMCQASQAIRPQGLP